MEAPSVPTTVRDSARNVEYRILAYRALSEAEAVQQVRVWLSQNRRPAKNRIVEIWSLIGARD